LGYAPTRQDACTTFLCNNSFSGMFNGGDLR
jgi:hypothetical protein